MTTSALIDKHINLSQGKSHEIDVSAGSNARVAHGSIGKWFCLRSSRSILLTFGGSDSSSKKENVRLWSMKHVMDPSLRLLYS